MPSRMRAARIKANTAFTGPAKKSHMGCTTQVSSEPSCLLHGLLLPPTRLTADEHLDISWRRNRCFRTSLLVFLPRLSEFWSLGASERLPWVSPSLRSAWHWTSVSRLCLTIICIVSPSCLSSLLRRPSMPSLLLPAESLIVVYVTLRHCHDMKCTTPTVLTISQKFTQTCSAGCRRT